MLFVPRRSYRPLRRVHPDIYNLQMGDLECPPSLWRDIEKRIREECSGRPDWLNPNLELAKILHGHVSARDIKSYQRQVPGFAVTRTPGHSIRFWGDFYFVEGDRPVMFFLDPRLSNGLGPAGRKVVFSVQVHACATGDFEDTLFKIFQFPGKGKNPRGFREYLHDPASLYSMEELNSMFDETYRIWFEVEAERDDQARRKTGTTGSLL